MSEWRQADWRKPVSATDAAFIGFTLARREPLAFLGWTLASLLSAAANFAVQVILILPTMTGIAKAQTDRAASGTVADPSAVFAGMGELWRGNLIVIALALVFTAIINTAVYRALLRPQQRGFAYLRLGLDELRQFVTILVLWLVMLGVYIASFIAGVIVAVVLGVSRVGEQGGAGRVGIIVAIVACFCLPLLIVGLKLSFAGPMTFAERRVTLFASWRATAGRFWSLLGAYVLSFCVLLVAGIVFMVVVFGVGLAVSGGMGGLSALRSVRGPGASDAMRSLMLSPAVLSWLVLSAPWGALWLATIAGIPAALYAQGRPSSETSGPDRSHAFGAGPPVAPAPPPPDTEYPIVPPRPSPPDTL